MSASTSSSSNKEIIGIRYPYPVQALTFSPTGSQTIYFSNLLRVPTSSLNRSKIFVEETVVITGANVYSFAATAGTDESWSMYIRVNGTTDYLVETVSAATNERIFNNSSLNITVNAGEYFEMKMDNPPWSIPPASVVLAGNVFTSNIN